MSGNVIREAPVRVVIADDHPMVRDGVKGMLAASGQIEVVGEAASGPEAVARVRAVDPDVVLMDLRMPTVASTAGGAGGKGAGGEGVAAITELRARDHARPVILVLTTYDSDRDVHAAIDAGADGYLLKALSRDELINAVVGAAHGRNVLAPVAADALIARRRHRQLTDREVQVLVAVAAGGTNRAVAQDLGVSEATVKTHLLHIYAKLEVRDRAAAVRVAYERGLLS